MFAIMTELNMSIIWNRIAYPLSGFFVKRWKVVTSVRQ